MFTNKDFKAAFSPLRASEETLTEVLEMGKHLKSKTTNYKRTMKLSTSLAIAALMELALGATAFAAVGYLVYENPGEMMEAFFGSNGHESGEGLVEYDESGRLVTNLPAWESAPVDETLVEEEIAPNVYDPQTVVTCGDYTVTVESFLYDPATKSVLVYYTIENPNGVKGYKLQPNGQLWWPPTGSGVDIYITTMEYLDEEKSTDTKLYLCAYDALFGENEISLHVNVGRESEKVTIPVTQSSEMSSLKLEKGALAVSPVAIGINYKQLGFDTHFYVEELVIRYADGSEYVVVDDDAFINNSAYALDSGNYEEVTYMFNRIIDTEQIASVVVNGNEYTVE